MAHEAAIDIADEVSTGVEETTKREKEENKEWITMIIPLTLLMIIIIIILYKYTLLILLVIFIAVTIISIVLSRGKEEEAMEDIEKVDEKYFD